MIILHLLLQLMLQNGTGLVINGATNRTVSIGSTSQYVTLQPIVPAAELLICSEIIIRPGVDGDCV